MYLRSFRIAPKTFPDSSSGCGVTCGWGDLLSIFSRRLFFFPPKAPPWDGRGIKGWVPRPLSPLPFCQHHQGREGVFRRRGTWAGPAPARWLAEPRLPSRLTAQLVPSHSCQPVVSQPALPLAPAPKTALGAAALPVQLPTENSPSLVPVAPLAGGSATSKRFSEKSGELSSLIADTEGARALGRKRLPLFALDIRGQGFSFPQAASTPG